MALIIPGIISAGEMLLGSEAGSQLIKSAPSLIKSVFETLHGKNASGVKKHLSKRLKSKEGRESLLKSLRSGTGEVASIASSLLGTAGKAGLISKDTEKSLQGTTKKVRDGLIDVFNYGSKISDFASHIF